MLARLLVHQVKYERVLLLAAGARVVLTHQDRELALREHDFLDLRPVEESDFVVDNRQVAVITGSRFLEYLLECKIVFSPTYFLSD